MKKSQKIAVLVFAICGLFVNVGWAYSGLLNAAETTLACDDEDCQCGDD